MDVQIVCGADADRLLADASFARQWDRLWSRCPWATAFQSHGFARAWYVTYRPRWEPLLLVAHAPGGELAGLLALATPVEPSGGRVVAAGAHQAEYQGWLAAPGDGDAFPPHAAAALRRHLPRAALALRYLPPGTPLGWLDDPAERRLSLLKRYARPLLRFGDGSQISQSLRKGGNKSRVRRLQKIGRVHVEPVADRAALERVLDTVIPYYDARRMAVNGSAPFRNDPLKRAFHLAMMDVPGLLHVTVLRVGELVASAHVNVRWGDEVQVGLIAHNPELARQSPGKLHILMLSEMLLREGYARLDLTPGGESYKERFANDADEVYALTLFPSAAARRRAVVRANAEDAARRVLAACKISPARAEAVVESLRRRGPLGLAARALSLARKRLGAPRVLHLYRLDLATRPPESPPHPGFRRNAMEDLLNYQPEAGAPSRREFVSDALARIEAGQHAYTFAEAGRLLHVAWLAERPSQELLDETLPGFSFPPDAALARGVHTFADARRRGLAMRCLRTMVDDASKVPGTKGVYAAVPAGDEAARRLFEKAGFTPAGVVKCRSRPRKRTAPTGAAASAQANESEHGTDGGDAGQIAPKPQAAPSAIPREKARHAATT